jgi:fructosamine-3-kinase
MQFIVMDFIVVNNVLADAADICPRIAAIHRNSVSLSEGKFGFPIHSLAQAHEPPLRRWYADWTELFLGMLIRLCREAKDRLSWPRDHEDGGGGDFDTLVGSTVPRLLRRLRANGQPIKPCLVHGNLSIDNIAINVATGDPIMFGPAALYAHNEYELGMWRRENMDLSYFTEYRNHYPPSEPIDEWEDRICLYGIKFSLAYLVSTPSATYVQKRYVISFPKQRREGRGCCDDSAG